jgi:hypothetical protein
MLIANVSEEDVPRRMENWELSNGLVICSNLDQRDAQFEDFSGICLLSNVSQHLYIEAGFL